MNSLSREQIEVAVTTIESLRQCRGMTQQQLARLAGLTQPTVSKVESRDLVPSAEQLSQMFRALGLKLENVLELDEAPRCISGYLATPLTGLANNPKKGEHLEEVVRRITLATKAEEFASPPFEIYWPGDHTHPLKNKDLSASAVFLMDRSQASGNDFVIMFCAEPSYGVGQENEIATQAGVPIIRLLPPDISRMMTGSFPLVHDILYAGSLDEGVHFDEAEFKTALKAVRLTYFHHRVFYRNLNGRRFGKRLHQLVAQRVKDNITFANDIGVSLGYAIALMEEPLLVSNPSARLLQRIAIRLDTKVSYLLGEEAPADPVWIESNESWRNWIDRRPDVSASVAVEMREDWRRKYRMNRHSATVVSFRGGALGPMGENDWELEHKKRASQSAHEAPRLF